MSESPFAAPASKLDPRWLAAWWVGPVIGLGLLLIVAVRPESNVRPRDYFTIGLVFGTFFGHALLAAAWAALGPLPLVWRLPLSLGWLGALVVALAMNMSIHGPGGADGVVVVFACAIVGQWILAQAPLWGLAVGYGLRVRHRSEASLAINRKELQFGIRQLMIVTAVVAVVLGIGRVTLAWLISSDDSGPILIISFLAIAGIVMNLPLVLAALLPRLAVPATLVVLLLIGLGTAAELPLLTALSGPAPGGGTHAGHFYGINGFQCFWVLAVIGALRLGGYGLTAVK